MKKLLFIFALFLPHALFAQNSAPVVTNVQALQRSETRIIDITYDVSDADGDVLTVTVMVSTDSGQTYTLSAVSITGDVTNVSPGTGKQIAWDAGEDHPEEYGANFGIKVIVSDELTSTPTYFTTHTITSSAEGARSVYAVDLDGDGNMDVLSASADDDIVAWYKNNGSETFTAYTIADDARGAHSVFAIDVDDDGDVDVLSASTKNDAVAWYENDGSESFTAHSIATDADGAHAVFAIDLDGDNDIDVLSASQFDNKIAWYENDGSETFTAHNIAVDADSAKGVYASDIDGDGDLDVIAAAYDNDQIIWYENDGSENFTANIITSSADGVRTVYSADVDDDGDMDVLSAAVNDGTTAWYENDGNGSFTTHVITSDAQSVRSVFSIDIDNDNDMDVIANARESEIMWYENDGLESFTERTITEDAEMVVTLFAADVDGDGKMDVLSASQLDNKIAWHENSYALNDTGFGLGDIFELDTREIQPANIVTFKKIKKDGSLHPKEDTIEEGGDEYEFSGFPSPLNFLNGGRLQFPEGSLDEDIIIMIKLPQSAIVEGDSVSEFGSDDPDKLIASGAEFIVIADGDTVSPYYFQIPIQLSLPYKTGLLAQLGINPENLTMSFLTDSTGVDTTGISNSTIDSSNNRLNADVAHFSTIVLAANTSDAVVPVELSVFTANAWIQNKIELKWMTLSETNNLRFDVLRSFDGNNFTRIASIPGHGTTNNPQNYLYIDDNNYIGTSYYMLKQVDFDGSFEYSSVIEVNSIIPGKFTLEQNFPNPFNPVTQINYQIPKASYVELIVYNILGQEVAKLVNSDMPAGFHSVNWDAANAASGTYIYKIQAGEFTAVKKMVVIK